MSNKLDDDALDLIDTDTLVAALRRRSTASIIALSNKMDENRESKVVYFAGGMAALGLSLYASAYVRKAFMAGKAEIT